MPLQENVSLNAYSSYRIGGPARYFWRAKDAAEIKKALAFARRLKQPVFILGGGTNLLIPDEGFPGLVLKLDIKFLRRRGNKVEAGAGTPVSELLKFAAKHGLSGLEWAGGLPGTVGGAVRGNAGCFGGETKDAISSVRSLDVKTGKIISRRRNACRFKYRSSIFKEKGGGEIILSAVFTLSPGRARDIRAGIRDKVQHRRERHPMEYPNIGSIFKNIPVQNVPKSRQKELVYNVKTDPFPVIPAARLITKAGLKGRSRGGAQISEKHPNFIINVRRAREKDVAALMDLVKKEIRRKFSVKMEEEVERLRTRFVKIYARGAKKPRKR